MVMVAHPEIVAIEKMKLPGWVGERSKSFSIEATVWGNNFLTSHMS